jgi:hypothetical protein
MATALAAFSVGNAGLAQGEDPSADGAWPRFHIGAALGKSHLSGDLLSAGAPPEVLERLGNRSPPDDTGGWKLAFGFRPARAVGMEIQYVDFGEAEIPPPTGNGIVRTHVDMETSADAIVLAALLFVPLRSRPFDVYGKVGVAKLDGSLRVHALVTGAPCVPLACNFNADLDDTGTHPYLAVGLRHPITRGVAFRVEYEAIDGDVGDDTRMFSLGFALER